MAKITGVVKSRNLLQILVHMVQHRRRGYTTAELVNYLEALGEERIAIRTAQRYAEALVKMPNGVVEKRMENGRWVYGLPHTVGNSLCLPVNRNSMLAFFLLRRTQGLFDPKNVTLTEFFESIVELGSVKESDELFSDLDDTLNESTHTFDNQSRFDVDNNVFEVILTGLMKKQMIKTTYHGSADDAPKYLDLRPVKLVLYRNQLYLYCWSKKQGNCYFTKICRIKTAKLTDKKFEITAEEMKRIDEKLKNSGGVWTDASTPVDVVVRFPKNCGLALQERPYHQSQKVVPAGKGTVELTLHVPVDQDLVQWLLMWGEHVTVEQPDELKKELKRVGKAIAGKY